MGCETHRYTVHVDLEDDGAGLSQVVGPVADADPGLLSVRRDGSTARPGRSPAELQFECTPAEFSSILETLEERDVSVREAGIEDDVTEFAVVLTGDHLEERVTETLDAAKRASRAAGVSLTVEEVEFSWQGDRLSGGAALVRLVTEAETVGRAVEFLRGPVAARDLRLIEPEETVASG